MTPDFSAPRAIVQSGINNRAYPAATVEVGRLEGSLWREAFGRLTYDSGASPAELDTIFDLASLTKVIATTSAAMRSVERGDLALETPLERHVAGWRHERVTVRHLLDHSSGLPAHARFWLAHEGRSAVETAILELALDYEPGSGSIYSDPAFIMLGLILERVGHAPLDRQLGFLNVPAEEVLSYLPPADLRSRMAPTEHDSWRGRELVGEVHDENAAALGGVAGHAGLFGTVGAVGAFARLVLSTFRSDTALGTPDLMRTFAAKARVPGSSRGLGWDTMLPTSSCGARMSPTAIGHVGFTGTSIWIDWERDLYVVWLTNRVHPTRENQQLAGLRPAFHDAVIAAVD